MPREYKFRSEVTVDWDRTPTIKGTVLDRKTLKVKRKDGDEDATYLLVDSGPVLYRVFETAALGDLIDAAATGDGVEITYLETVKLSNGQSMRTFDARLYTESDDDEDVEWPNPVA